MVNASLSNPSLNYLLPSDIIDDANKALYTKFDYMQIAAIKQNLDTLIFISIVSFIIIMLTLWFIKNKENILLILLIVTSGISFYSLYVGVNLRYFYINQVFNPDIAFLIVELIIPIYIFVLSYKIFSIFTLEYENTTSLGKIIEWYRNTPLKEMPRSAYTIFMKKINEKN